MPQENNTELSIKISEKANVNALLDSVYAIDQVFLNLEENNKITDQSNQEVLKANLDHIKLQLSKKIYQDVLTQDQKDSLNSAATKAEAALV